MSTGAYPTTQLPPSALLLGNDSPEATARLACFHHAGGAASAYAGWSKALPKTVSVLRVQLPGREARFSESFEECLVDASIMVADALHQLAGNVPLVLFGHSMGAAMAFHAARRLTALGDSRLCSLVVSGCAAANRIESQVARRGALHTLDDRALTCAVTAFGGLPPAIAESSELMEALVPIFRADFRLVETYAYPAAPPMNLPIHALHGDLDEHVELSDMLAWSNETTSRFVCTRFKGSHFFLREEADAVLATLGHELQAAQQASAAFHRQPRWQ